MEQGRIVQRHRILQGLSVEQLAERIDVSHNTIHRWEAGKAWIMPMHYEPLARALYPYDERAQLACFMEITLGPTVKLKGWIDWLFLAQHLTGLGGNGFIRHTNNRGIGKR